jgi:hypothetical protein
MLQNIFCRFGALWFRDPLTSGAVPGVIWRSCESPFLGPRWWLGCEAMAGVRSMGGLRLPSRAKPGDPWVRMPPEKVTNASKNGGKCPKT